MTAVLWALLLLAFLAVDARPIASDGKILVAYLPYWKQVPASYMDFSRITHLLYAFATLEPTGTIKLPVDDKKVLPDFAASAHAGKAKAILCIGGWGIHPFSTAFNSASGISTFTASVSDVLNRYGFDGVDVDWEYPGQESAPGNPWLPQDSANFLKALKALRGVLPGKVISAAVPVFTWSDANGEGLTNLVEYSNVLDFVSIMAYDDDVSPEGDAFTGANAPLIQNKNNLGPARASVRDSIATWVAAGFPLSKIVLGTPFYGHAMTPDVALTANTDVSDIYVKKKVSSESQSISFDAIYSLTQDTTGTWLRRFDTWTQTPWLYNLDTNIFISYDDARSIEVKARYAACLGLKGMMTWFVLHIASF
ncbi:glycoside hydrolase [Chytriomyces cf. hyalinus JEL632]|nr:glycoside hydrolase [Chytriomyces cf. hyalinus JEL632]